MSSPTEKHTLIYWLGGSPCSGKSSIAQRLARDYGLTLYLCDDAMGRHMAQATPDRQPTMARLAGMTPDEIWLEPVEAQVRRVQHFYREEFPLIMADIASLPRPLIVEGVAAMPELVAALIDDPARAIWLVPSAEFQLEHYSRRPWVQEIVGATSDPAQAWANWMARDAAFADRMAAQAATLNLICLRVDGQHDLDAMAGQVTRHFQLDVPRAP
ncbi:MAG: hypothetical protein IH587_03800 [Anaerolineae bacterium]|nr:hypothetical protein [Anaerolineae bacterium]